MLVLTQNEEKSKKKIELLVVIQCLKHKILAHYSVSPGTLSVCKQHKWTKPEKVFISTCLQVSLPNSSSVYYNILYTKKFIIAVYSFTVSDFVDKTHNICLTCRTQPCTEQTLLDHPYIMSS